MAISKQLVASLAVITVIASVVAFLVLAPLHRVYDVDECREAYANARSAADTSHVDLRRYAEPGGAPNHRCGELRGVFADTSGTLLTP